MIVNLKKSEVQYLRSLIANAYWTRNGNDAFIGDDVPELRSAYTKFCKAHVEHDLKYLLPSTCGLIMSAAKK